MTLLSVTKDVCAAVGVAIPQSIFTNLSGNRTMQEMLALANEMAQRIAYDNREWQKLKKTKTYIGDGVTTAFDLPANFKRMLLTSSIWRSTCTEHPMIFIADTDEWVQRRNSPGLEHSYGEWTIIGDQIHIFPALAVDEAMYFAFLDKNCIGLASGGYGDSFQNDGDVYALDERLFKLGMIWQWKQNKGGAYAEDLGTYGDAMARLAGADSPAPILLGRRAQSMNSVVFVPQAEV
jgi:hypothetical protein